MRGRIFLIHFMLFRNLHPFRNPGKALYTVVVEVLRLDIYAVLSRHLQETAVIYWPSEMGIQWWDSWDAFSHEILRSMPSVSHTDAEMWQLKMMSGLAGTDSENPRGRWVYRKGSRGENSYFTEITRKTLSPSGPICEETQNGRERGLLKERTGLSIQTDWIL